MPTQSKKNPQAFKKVARPRPQTLGPTTDPPRRPPGFIPRFSFQLGDSIGPDLTVIGHLSSGGKTEIYQVWSTFFICALTCKILLPGVAPQSQETLAFKREAGLLSRLAHPNIVRIFGRGKFDRRDFLLQEYLHGPSLFDLIDTAPKRQLPIPDSIKAAIHVGAALNHLHHQGYVHRDLKPANIILRGGIPVLVDFDSAYRLQTGRRPRRRGGTDPYMAPEQCRMEELSPATDVYGLGAILYEMLTGRWPFEDDLVRNKDRASLEGRYPQVRGAPPSEPDRFNEQIPPELAKVVLRCLAPVPDRRFPSVRDLVRELAVFLQGKDQMWPETLDLSRRVA